MDWFWKWILGLSFVTPRFVREFVYEASDQRLSRLGIRVLSAVLFYGVGGFILGGLFGAGIGLVL